VTGRRDVFDRVPGLVQLRERQAGVCLRSQLDQLGVSLDAVRCHIDALRWRPLGPLVVALHLGELTTAARRWAVVLNSGADAALGAWTALDVWGLRGWERSTTHVVVARGCDPPALPPDVGNIKLHESRRHQRDHVRRKDGLPVHSIERAAVDAGAWSPSARAACGLLAATVQQQLTTANRLLTELDSVGRVRHRRVMRAALADIAGGSQALSEIDFVRFCRARGLPEPVRQVVRRDLSGRRRYLDVEWRLPDGRRLSVEIDGIGHLDAARWYDDLLRTAELVATGSSDPLRLPALAVRLEPDRVERIIRALLGCPR
jgi:hypothetical protein